MQLQEDLALVLLNESSEVEALWRELGRYYSPVLWEALPDFDVYVAKLADHALTYALMKDDKLAGGFSLYANDLEGRQAFITQFAIHGDFRRQGLGKVLLNAACDIAQERGMEQIGLEVLRDNRGAQALYEGSGFEKTDESGQTSYLMSKELNGVGSV